MTAMTRSLTSLTLAAALLGGLTRAQSDWVRDQMQEWAKLGELRQLQQREDRRKADLTRHAEAITYRIAAKEAVMDDLFAGRIDLLAAAARFRALHEHHPDECRRAWPGRSDGERSCRQVIGWVHSRRELLSPGLADEWACRLEADLQRHLDDYGDVRLPNNP